MSDERIVIIEAETKKALNETRDYLEQDVEACFKSKAPKQLLEEIETNLSLALEKAEGFRRLTDL